MIRQFLLSTMGLVLLSGVTAFSQDDSSQADQQLPSFEIRAIRSQKDAPFAATVVSGAELQKANNGQDIPFMLQHTPSAVVSSDAGAGIGYTGLRIRGTDGSRINVTLNGVPVNDAESQGTFFVNFGDLGSSVSSIQIQRGVGTSTNGAAAFGATMSISNLELRDTAGVEVAVNAGSFNTSRYTLKAGTGMLQGGWQFDVRLSKIASDGFIDRSSSNLKALQLNAGWRISPATQLKAMVMTGTERTGQAWNGVPEEKLYGTDSALLAHYYNNLGSTYFTTADSINLFQSGRRTYNGFTYKGQTDNYQQDYYQLFADHAFSSKWTGGAGIFLTRGKGYYEEMKQDQYLENYGLPVYVPAPGDTVAQSDLIRQLWLDNYYYGTVFSLLYRSNRTEATFGGAYTRYDGTHFGELKWGEAGVPADHRWYTLGADKTDFNLYAKAQQRMGRFTVFGDIQLRKVDYTINGFRNNPDLRPVADYLFLNPKAGLSYSLSTGTAAHRVYGSLAVANKEPNRDDFEAATTAQPRPEQLYDTELGYEIRKRKWQGAVNAYYMSYKDQLVLTGKINDVGSYARTNVPESYRMGLELMGSVSPFSWLTLEANATLSENKISGFTEYIDNYDDNTQLAIDHGQTDLAFSPGQVYSGILRLKPIQSAKAGTLEVDMLQKHVGRQYLDNTSNLKRSIKPYSITDIRIRYTIRTRFVKELGLSLALNNVFNKLYESNGYTFSYIYGGSTTTQNYYYPQAGFNMLAGVRLKL